MRATEEDALICDFAQYYHIYDIDALDIKTAATLACGLPAESRTIKKLCDGLPDPEKIYRLSFLDALSRIEFAIWQTHTKRRLNKPESKVAKLLEQDDDTHQEVKGFSTPEEFEAAWDTD